MSGLRYAVVGTGALGGFYGGMLAHAGEDVHFLLHSDYDFVCKNGLRIDSVSGNFVVRNINSYESTGQMPECDVVLVCLKTTNNRILKELLPPILHSGTCIIMIQNGLQIEEYVAGLFPDQPIAGGTAFICSYKTGPGHITHLDYGKLTIASFQNENREILEHVCSDFNASGVQSEFSENLKELRWKKLVWNIPYNGLCVTLNTTTEKLMNHPVTYQLVKDLMSEVVHAANACGISAGDDFVGEMLDLTLKMKPYTPSMMLDFQFKRPLEIEAIYSAPLAEAGRNGFNMPKVAMLASQLRFIQDNYLLRKTS
jgi:2-dehydropantoate 2-reductase